MRYMLLAMRFMYIDYSSVPYNIALRQPTGEQKPGIRLKYPLQRMRAMWTVFDNAVYWTFQPFVSPKCVKVHVGEIESVL